MNHPDPQREHKGQTQQLVTDKMDFLFTIGKTKNFIVLCTIQRLQQPKSVDYKNELHMCYHTLSVQDQEPSLKNPETPDLPLMVQKPVRKNNSTSDSSL